MAYMYNWANVMYRAEWPGNKRVCDYLKGIQNGGGRHPEQIEAWHTGEIELIWDSEKRSVTFYTDGTVYESRWALNLHVKGVDDGDRLWLE